MWPLGVSAAEIDDAEEEDDRKAALIGLIVQRAAAASQARAAAAAREDALRAELAGLKLSELRRRARSAGASAADMDDADDADDPQAALVGLILALQHADEPEPEPEPEPEACLAPTLATSHFMAHYNAVIAPKYATEVLPPVLHFLRAYADSHGLSAHMARVEEFFVELQRQTGGHAEVDVLGKLGPTATLLWTSAIKLKGVPLAHTKELCSLINAALRDDIEARPTAAKNPLRAPTPFAACTLSAVACFREGLLFAFHSNV